MMIAPYKRSKQMPVITNITKLYRIVIYKNKKLLSALTRMMKTIKHVDI